MDSFSTLIHSKPGHFAVKSSQNDSANMCIGTAEDVVS